ncbi:hypothetical protein ALC62_02785 [Cyphomyrmex costatus]|uniref:Uncharacterized protein n=1 Tax=Cyphomyrmex costatus TaxID=456900 RepID=A0A151IMV7_9HYME|nr:hypothetical protein ALC62_02785 [Cyphomyrmex costatus]
MGRETSPMSKIAVAKDSVVLDVGNRSLTYIDGTIGLSQKFMGVAIKIDHERLLHCRGEGPRREPGEL